MPKCNVPSHLPRQPMKMTNAGIAFRSRNPFSVGSKRDPERRGGVGGYTGVVVRGLHQRPPPSPGGRILASRPPIPNCKGTLSMCVVRGEMRFAKGPRACKRLLPRVRRESAPSAQAVGNRGRETQVDLGRIKSILFKIMIMILTQIKLILAHIKLILAISNSESNSGANPGINIKTKGKAKWNQIETNWIPGVILTPDSFEKSVVPEPRPLKSTQDPHEKYQIESAQTQTEPAQTQVDSAHIQFDHDSNQTDPDSIQIDSDSNQNQY